jgi:hypothetical protein
VKARARARELAPYPCARCIALAREGRIRTETIQRPPRGAFAPLARDGSGPCCLDCASADGLARFQGLSFVAARIAVGNERQEQYRLPGVPMGLVAAGMVRASARGDFEDQLAWLDRNEWFGVEGTGD